MASNKKDLEIIYNLQWKKPSGQGDVKASVIGMYDIPATTLNWETFKSYLLKNCGATGEDVKLYYVNNEDKEFCIDSQVDFQLALYSFREKARNGDVINLRLDGISDQSRVRQHAKKMRRIGDEEKKCDENSSAPPEWFKKAMKEFKREFIEDVTTSIIKHLSNAKAQNTASSCCHSRKSKIEYCKRPKKVSATTSKPDNEHRALMKSFKLDRKLDSKLEKLENKALKIKEKLGCIHLKYDDHRPKSGSSKSRPIGLPVSDTEQLMDASAVGQHDLTIPHMSGGEIYQQEWEVTNIGKLKWNEDTELRYAWGSEALKPIDESVPCPPLNPGESGTVSVFLEIPKKPGFYESYWHFHHEGRRFGHWLGCQVMVDSASVNCSSPILLSDNESKHISYNLTMDVPNVGCDKFEENDDLNTKDDLEKAASKISTDMIEDSIKKLENFENLKIMDCISCSDSDNDNQSIISLIDSSLSENLPNDEFVVVPVMAAENADVIKKETNEEQEGAACIENVCIPVSHDVKVEKLDNLTTDCNYTPDTAEDCNSSIYAYVTLNGEKVPVPKCFLNPKYLLNAEDAPNPTTGNIPSSVSSPTPTIDSLAPTINTSTTPSIILGKEENKDASLENSKDAQLNVTIKQQDEFNTITKKTEEQGQEVNMSNSRTFMFPSNIPGFEILSPSKSYCNHSSVQSNENFRKPSCTNRSTAHSLYRTRAAQYDCTSPYTTNPFGYSYSYPGFQCRDVPPPPSKVFIYKNGNYMEYPNRSAHKFGSHIDDRSRNSQFTCPLAANNIQSGQNMPRNSSQSNTATSPGYYYTAPAHLRIIRHSGSRKNKMTPENSNRVIGNRHASSSDYKPSPDHPYSPPGTPIHVSSSDYKPSPNVHLHSPPGTPIPITLSTPESRSNATSSRMSSFESANIFPTNTLVSGAVNVASSAINTARSVLNLFTPSGYQQTQDDGSISPREAALNTLVEMGFYDCDLNNSLLNRYNNDITRVVMELLNK